MLHKRGVVKNFSKFTNKHKKQSSGSVLSKDFLKNSVNLKKNIFVEVSVFNKVASCKPINVRSSYWKCSVKQIVLKKFLKLHRKKSVLDSLFLIKLQFRGPAILIKKTPLQLLSCETSKIIKNY